jgi:hypothetical protein
MFRDVIVPLAIEALAGATHAIFVAIICFPIVFIVSMGIKREYSWDFWFRTIILSQFLFWGAIFVDASAARYGYFKDFGDVVQAAFRFLVSIPATALMMRTAMRYRTSENSTKHPTVDSKDRLDHVFDSLEKINDASEKAAKIGKALPKK